MADFYFILNWTRGVKWTSPDDSAFTEHVEYMNRMNKEGKLVLGGPFEDGSGSITIFKCTEDEMNSIIENDPGFQNNVLRVSVKKMEVFYK